MSNSLLRPFSKDVRIFFFFFKKLHVSQVNDSQTIECISFQRNLLYKKQNDIKLYLIPCVLENKMNVGVTLSARN